MPGGGIVGRQRELDAAAGFLDSLGEGAAAALVFAGEPGIGKTTVWLGAVELARERRFVVLSTRAAEVEAKLGFAALGDLLAPVADAALQELPAPQRRAVAVALLREDPGKRPVDQRAVGAATLGILKALASTTPVVVAVDDLQWLDRPSARALAFAWRRLGELPVGLLASERIDGSSGLPIDLARTGPDGRVVRMKLGPLSLAVLHEMLKRRLGRSLPRPTLRRIRQASGGNPFFALELARVLPEDVPAGSAPLPVPDNLRQLVLRHIRKLPSDSRAMLLAAAAQPSPTVELVAAGMGANARATLAALEPAETAGIVYRDRFKVWFAHPLFAAGVYSAAAPAERRRTHRRLAEAIDELEERARHLALAAEGFDEGTAAILDEAAEHARRRGAPDTAAGLADQARRLTPPDRRGEVLRRTIKAAEYQFHAGELRRAREALEAVVPLADDDRVQAHALRLLGEIKFHESSFLEAIPLFEQALELSGEDDPQRALIEIHLAFGSNAAGDFPAARDHARRALELAEPLDPGGALAEALAVASVTDYLLGGGLDEARIETALELEDPDRQVTAEMRPSLIAGYLMLWEGRLGDSIRILGAQRRRLIDRGEESDLPLVSSYLGWAECWRGNLDAAERFCQEALDCAASTGSEAIHCWSLAFAAVPPAYAGDPVSATARAAACERQAGRAGVPVAERWARWALAVLALSRGDAQDAQAALAPLVSLIEERGLPEPVLGFFLPDAIESLIASGELERVQSLLELFEEAATRLERGWALMAAGRCRALLHSALGRLDEAAEAAHAAVAIGEALELRLECARTLLVAGQIERRRRRKAAARALLQRAHELFEASGARLWAARARDELERASLRRAVGDQLTESERRVAELAAAGLTNRAVAARLFMSPKTVEANLARAYRKLGIHSRAELGARLGVRAGEAQA
jgi:DNA-binding CsgD family transcriptional regulator